MLVRLQLWSATLYVLPIRMHHRSEKTLSMAAIEMHFVVNMFRVFPYVLDLISHLNQIVFPCPEQKADHLSKEER